MLLNSFVYLRCYGHFNYCYLLLYNNILSEYANGILFLSITVVFNRGSAEPKDSAGLLANIDVNTPEIGNTMFSNLLTTM